MSFLSAIFLWGLPLVGIPAVIHLLHRRRRRVIEWGAMQFLLEAATRNKRMWRWQDWLLMAIRTAAVLALVMALARPMVNGGWLGGNTGREFIVIADASLSTEREVDGEPVWRRITAAASDFVDGLASGDRFRAMLAADTPYWLSEEAVTATSATKRQLREQLDSRSATLATANLHRCVQSAVDTPVDESTTSKVVVVFTDGYAHGWQQVDRWRSLRRSLDDATVATSVQVINVVDGAFGLDMADSKNLAVDSMGVSRGLVGSGDTFTLTARVTNHGGSRSPTAQLKWNRGDEAIGQSSIPPLGAGQSTDVTLEHQIGERGAHLISCTLDYEDALAGDNEAHVVVNVVDEAPVLFVQSDDDADAIPSPLGFVLASLGRGENGDDRSDASGENWHSVFAPSFAAASEVTPGLLAGYRAVVLFDPGDMSAEAVDSVEQFVRDGGGVWLALGNRTHAGDFNAEWYDDGLGLSPLPIRDAVGELDNRDEFEMLHPPDLEHPATVLLGDTERLDIDDVKIYRRLPFGEADGDDAVSVLLETTRGQPLAVEQYSGRGRVIVQGMPLDVSWSNLPLCEVFVPLVQEWLWYLVEPTAVRYNLDVADAVVVRPGDASLAETGADAADVDLPTGEQVSVAATSDELGPLYRFTQTAFPGVYTVRLGREGNESSYAYVVRRDPAESDLKLLGDTERSRLEQLAGVRFVTDVWDDPQISTLPVRREPVWDRLLIGLLVLFACELVFVTWLAWQRRVVDTATPT